MQRRQPKPIPLTTIVVGGVMGLLAGYGALSLLGQKGIGPLAVRQAVPIATATPHVRSESPTRNPVQQHPQQPHHADKSQQPPPIAPIEPSLPSDRRGVVQIGKPDPENRRPPTINRHHAAIDDGSDSQELGENAVVPKNGSDASQPLPPPSALITLKLDDDSINVIATPVGIDPKELHCDIALSRQLIEDSSVGDPYGLQIALPKLSSGDERTHELPLGIKGAGAALVISVTHHATTSVCQIKPKYSLPVSGIESFTTKRIVATRKKLNNVLDDVSDAKNSISGLKSTLQTLKSNLSEAESISRRGGNSPAEVAQRSQASAAANKLRRSIGSVQLRINNATSLIADEPAIHHELDCLEQISAYGERVANKSQIYVRFYKGDVTVKAEVK